MRNIFVIFENSHTQRFVDFFTSKNPIRKVFYPLNENFKHRTYQMNLKITNKWLKVSITVCKRIFLTGRDLCL